MRHISAFALLLVAACSNPDERHLGGIWHIAGEPPSRVEKHQMHYGYFPTRRACLDEGAAIASKIQVGPYTHMIGWDCEKVWPPPPWAK